MLTNSVGLRKQLHPHDHFNKYLFVYLFKVFLNERLFGWTTLNGSISGFFVYWKNIKILVLRRFKMTMRSVRCTKKEITS